MSIQDVFTSVVNEKATSDVLKEIQGERIYQTDKWGHDFDNKHAMNDWTAYIVHYASKHMGDPNKPNQKPDEQYRENMIRVAALAVAAVEAYNRRNK